MKLVTEERLFSDNLKTTIISENGENTYTKKCRVEAQPDKETAIQIIRAEKVGKAKLTYRAEMTVEQEYMYDKVVIHDDGDVLFTKEFGPVNLNRSTTLDLTYDFYLKGEEGGLEVKAA